MQPCHPEVEVNTIKLSKIRIAFFAQQYASHKFTYHYQIPLNFMMAIGLFDCATPKSNSA
jgi:hypothetical protein